MGCDGGVTGSKASRGPLPLDVVDSVHGEVFTISNQYISPQYKSVVSDSP